MWDDPRGLKVDWAKLSAEVLARMLDDPRPAVQRRAIRDLAKGDAARVVSALTPIVLGPRDPRTFGDDEVYEQSRGFQPRKASQQSLINER